MSSRCDRNSGCLLGQVIRHLGSASTCRRNLESVSSRLVTGTSFTNPEISGLFFFFFFFFSFSSSGKCFIIIFVSRLSRPSLYHATWLHPSASLPLSFMVPCCCEQNSFFTRQMVATPFSLNKKAKQLLRCKQSHGQQIVSASSAGEVSL